MSDRHDVVGDARGLGEGGEVVDEIGGEGCGVFDVLAGGKADGGRVRMIR